MIQGGASIGGSQRHHLGGGPRSQSYQHKPGHESIAGFGEAVNYAWSQGAIIIAAAGNKGGSEPSYPAYYDNCLAVAGTNKTIP